MFTPVMQQACRSPFYEAGIAGGTIQKYICTSRRVPSAGASRLPARTGLAQNPIAALYPLPIKLVGLT